MRRRRIPVKKSSITRKKKGFTREDESSNAMNPASVMSGARKTASTAVAKSKNGMARSGIKEEKSEE